jgi:hypothetical protein
MKIAALIGVAILAVGLTSYNRQQPDSTRSVVLPGSHLIGCKSSNCSRTAKTKSGRLLTTALVKRLVLRTFRPVGISVQKLKPPMVSV